MVIVVCSLSCTIRRCAPSANSDPYLGEMHRLMERVSQAASGQVVDQKRNSRLTLEPYEDKLLVITYDVSIRFNSHVKASNALISAFCNETKYQAESDTSYYLSIKPMTREEELESYFFDLPLQNFALGFMSNAVGFHTQFNYQQELMPLSRQSPTATIELDGEQVQVDFAVSTGRRFRRMGQGEIAPTTEVYRLTINFSHMSPALLVQSTSTAVDLCFLTSTPVQFWRTQFDVTEMVKISFEKTNWIRTCSVKSGSEISNQRAFTKETLGGCNALMLRFSQSAQIQTLIESLQVWSNFNAYHTTLNYSPKETFLEAAPFVDMEGQIADDINWMLAAIHSIGYRVRYQLKDRLVGYKFMELVNKYASRSKDDHKHLHNALQKTYDVISLDSDRFLHVDRVLLHFLNGPKELDELVMTETRLVKRLVITPSRIVFQAPSLMHDNRILRAFDADSAASCSFQNDDMTGFGAVSNSIDFVEEAIGAVLRKGVQVAKRHYQFLGCSGSQLKSNGCWMYAKDPLGKTAADIRSWMGDLEHIRNPGTYLSRMGQCFSDTTAAELDWDIEIEWKDPDIEGGQDQDGKPYCFSDGVGRISEECLKLVFMKLNRDETLPSAFQVRLGGSKGMLTLDKKLTGKKIMVRDSMFKFQSTHATVEVMRRTQPTSLFLNNQVITLLSQLDRGIPDQIFIRFLNTMLHRLADVLLDDDKALVALTQSGFSCCYAKLHRAGFKFTTDPFFKGALKAIACARINNVKRKTRIEIPQAYGRAMLGVMDEEDVLEYGEVFVQYSADIKDPKVNPVVLEGTVVVSKMPALHPGDIRKLKAVDRPELRHLVDCIVFPSKGPRPHPNEMAGSDLDGDEYFVTWHPDLIFRGQNATPMNFPSIRKQQHLGPITVDDMVNFIVRYIVNDKVGVISNAHLAWADKSTIHSRDCTNLARIFCHVIDFSKTGYLPDEVAGRNLISLLPEEYPDFMGKEDHKKTYQSARVLGKLYRISQRLEQAVTTIDKEDTERINAGSNWTIDQRFLIPGHEEFIEEAKKLYAMYAEFLDAEQRRYGIESEEELVSGCVIKIKGMYSRSDEVFDIEKRLRQRMKDVRTLTLEKFDEFLSKSDDQNKSKQEMFAAACYVITYKDKRPHRSFPWVFAEPLLRILQRTNASGPDPPLVSLSKSIDVLDIADVDRRFRMYKLERPKDDGLAKVYHVMINWGQKSKFLAGEYHTEYETLRMQDFVELLDKIFEEDEDVINLLDGETGPLLCAVFRAVTKLDDNLRINGRPLSSRAVINMKRQILLGHHQLARNPRADCLMTRTQGVMTKRIDVPRQRWDKIKSSVGQLVKEYKEKFNVTVTFRRKRNGGSIMIKGEDANVFEFNEFWLDKAPN